MIIDRVFLDANILFSVAYGSPGLKRLWKWAQEGHCLLFVSQYVIEEAKRNLVETSHFKRLQSCIARAKVVPEVDPQVPCPIHLPKKDQPVLLSAISARVIEERVVGDVTNLDLKGKMTLGEGDELLKDKINSLVSQGHKKLLLNLEGVPYIDSGGLGEIVRTYTTVSRQGGK